MTDYTDPYSGRTQYTMRLRVTGNGGNVSWELRALGSGTTYCLDAWAWQVKIGGQTWSGNKALDFRSSSSILLASGTATGHGSLAVSAKHGPDSCGIFGTAQTSGTYVASTVPPAPSGVGVDQATPVSLRYRFSSNGTGGSPITRWEYQYSTSPTFASGNSAVLTGTGTQTVTGLTPGTTYYFRSRGVNAVGTGAWSGTSSGTTLAATPPGMTVTPNLAGTSASVALTPPTGISTVDSYDVERRPVGGSTTAVNTTTTPLVVTGLTPGGSYEWRARANIGAYSSPYTDWTLVTQPKPNTSPGDYFDGSTADRTDTDFQWTSTVNNSTSIAVAKAPLGWRTFAEGNALSGGLGVVTRATGGRSGVFGAQVIFFSDTTAAGFRAGTAVTATGVQEVAEGGVYWGSVYVAPSRSQRMAAEIIWLDAAFAVLGTTLGAESVVPADPDPMVRLLVQGVAPAGAVYGAAGWRDVSGTGWSVWLGGDTVMMDDAMLTIGEVFPWFSGDTTDTPEFGYDWLGTPNASVSMRVALSAGEIDPLADPDCPPIPAAPQPPAIDDDCIEETGSWRRYWAIVSQDQISQWLDLVPTLEVTTGALAARQVRIRVYANPDGTDPDDFDASTWQAEQIISYMPPLTVITLDGVAQRVWAEVNGGDAIAADRLLYGTGGGPATWPVLSCGVAYLVSFDVPLDAPEGNLSVDVALTTRML